MRHPDMVPFYIDASAKRYYYTRGEFEALVLQGSLVRPALFALFHILASCALAGMGRRDVATRMIEGLLDGSSMRFFGKEMPAAAPLRESDAEYEVRMGVAELGLERIVAPNMALHREAWKSFAAVAGGLFRALKKSPSCLGRSVLVSGFGGPSNLLVMLPAKTACMEHEGRIIEVFRDRGVAGIIMGYILLLAAIPLSVPAAAALSMMGALNRMRRGISSSGYGIAGGREKINNRLKA